MYSSIVHDFIGRERLKGYTEDTLVTKRRHIERFLIHMGYEYGALTAENVARYAAFLQEGLSVERFRVMITHLRQFYDFLMERGEAVSNPFDSLPPAERTNRPPGPLFTEDELKAILEASSTYLKQKSGRIMKRDRALLELLYSTGIRLNELVKLNIDDIDFTHRELVVRHGKGEKERMVPVGEEAMLSLAEYIEVRDEFPDDREDPTALFLGRQGGRLTGLSVRRMIHRRKEEAGISTPGVTHAFRRSCASHMLQHGAPITAIKRLLGHEDMSATETYTPVTDEELKGVHRESHPGGREQDDE